MFFLIRAIFWLTVVFVSILGPARAPEIARGADEIGTLIGEETQAKAKALCLDSPLACLHGASVLGQIVADQTSESKVKNPSHHHSGSASADARRASGKPRDHE